MSQLRPPRLPPLLLDELQGTDWVLEHGKKHWQLRIDGRLVAILPHGHPAQCWQNRNLLAVRSNIRHHKAKEAIAS